MNRGQEITKALAVFKPLIGCEVEVCVAYAKCADNHPKSPWHAVKDGDLPQAGKDCIFSYQGKLYKGLMYKDRALHFDDEFSPMLDINEVDYWMEIPELPKKEEL